MSVQDRVILISVHDVTPFYEKDVRLVLRELEKRKLHKITLAIIPLLNESFNTEEDYVGDRFSLLRHPSFVRLLKKLERHGAELMVHGLDHTDGQYILNPRAFKARLRLASRVFRKAFGHKSKGYLPPRWMTARSTDKIIARSFAYSENLTGIRLHRLRKRIFGFPITMESYSNNKNFSKDRVSPFINRLLAHANAFVFKTRIVRYSLHPREVRNGNFKATLKLLDKFLKKGYVPITYAELEVFERQ